MKKGYLIPAAVLTAILAFCVWNGAAASNHAARWRAELETADRLVQIGDWKGAAAAIGSGYEDWAACQTWLRCVSSHGGLDEAEAMFRRCAAFAESEEESELRAELADLRERLRKLAEMEELSLRNVL